jgi:hypothetical protein
MKEKGNSRRGMSRGDFLKLGGATAIGAYALAWGAPVGGTRIAHAQDRGRSALYPEDWYPGYTDEAGRGLQDFSYAGYRRGEAPLPRRTEAPVVNVVRPPYRADRTGKEDSTATIQRALDDVGRSGGGTVLLPEGTYRVRPVEDSNYALHMRYSNVVLRGDGPGKTFLFNDEPFMRYRHVVLVSPEAAPPDYDFEGDFFVSWHDAEDEEVAVAEDLPGPTRTVPLESVEDFEVGERIVVRQDATEAWIAEHGMTGVWPPPEELKGQVYYRVIEGVDRERNTITLDIPTRYYLKTRDNARVYRVPDPITEVGIEDLSIGMRENTTPGFGDRDVLVEGTGAWEVQHARAVYVNHVVDGWVRNVRSYRPEVNRQDVHVLSSGVWITFSRSVTVEDCDFRLSQYEGVGGNGYLYVFMGTDCLVEGCYAYSGRHNYLMQAIQTSGNVVKDSATEAGRLPSEMHRHLSVANLWDNVTVIDDQLEAHDRTGISNHGLTTTETVFWNTRGESCNDGAVVESAQWKWGYVIGTSGACSEVDVDPAARRAGNGTRSLPVDYTEFVGEGERLRPRSLYEDQLRRRIGGG